MTSGEIEDVLSSIRRLVSDGNRPVFRAAPRPFAREAEKLILTPALRVLPADEDTGSDRPAPMSRFVLTADTVSPRPTERPTLGTVITAIAAAVPAELEGWEPETGEPIGPFAPSLGSEGWIDDIAARRGAAPATPPADDDHVSPDDVVALQEADDDGWDDDGPSALPDLSAPLLDYGPEKADAPGGTAEAVEAMLTGVDAAALATMIRDILREELRGPLGERITTNLRKLVRAEIARTLTLRAED